MNTRIMRTTRGVALIWVMMLIPVLLAFILGGVTQLSLQQVTTAHVAFRTEALRRAHSGLEFALHEINLGGADFDVGDPNWDRDPDLPAPGPYKYKYEYQPAGTTLWEVEVIEDAPVGKVTIESTGKSQTLNKKISVRVIPPGQLSAFNYLVYTNAQAYLHSTPGTTMIVDGYNSENGDYLSALTLSPDKVQIRSDKPPWLYQDWETLSDALKPSASLALVIYGEVQLKADTVVHTPDPLEQPSPPYTEAIGAAVYSTDIGGQVQLIDGATSYIDPSTSSVTFPEPEVPSDAALQGKFVTGTSYLPLNLMMASAMNPPDATGTTHYQVCPGDPVDTKFFESIQATDGLIVDVGCTTDASDPAYCGTVSYNFAGEERSCWEQDSQAHEKTVEVAIKTTAEVSGYALEVDSTTGQPSAIRIHQPTKIFMKPGTYQEAVSLQSGGIQNLSMKSSGAINPAALQIYGHSSGAGYDKAIVLDTPTPFYGGLHYPTANITMKQGKLFGSMNGKAFTADGPNIELHWDVALAAATGGGGTSGSGGVIPPGSCVPVKPCLAEVGSLTFLPDP